jgi:hypothetical protein
MPATPADIGAAIRDVIYATWQDTTIAARYPSSRDATLDPPDGYFDNLADAQAVMNARGALIGVDRRRWSVEASDLVWPDLSSGLPSATLIDPEQAVNALCLTSRIELDLEAEATTAELFG